jgi:catechol 2,3-dioxygenase-like lactoylglutathione lyase family enzyme
MAVFARVCFYLSMSGPKIAGLNHLTLAVTDLQRSITFYRDVLGCELRAFWNEGAYLEAGTLWLCLSLDTASSSPERTDYTHYAFDVSAHDFHALAARVQSHSKLWKENKSEGASVYFLDPDGHRMELHAGSLAARIEHYQANPASGVTIV